MQWLYICMLCVHEPIKGPTKLVTIVKPNEILSPSDVSAVRCFFYHHRRWWCKRPTPSLYVWCGRDQKYITVESFSNPTSTKQSSKADRGARRRWSWPLYWQFIRWSDSGVNLYTDASAVEGTANPHRRQSSQSTRRRCWWPLHRRLMCPHDGFDNHDTVELFANAAVLVDIHSQVVLQCDWSNDLITDGS